MYKIFYICLQHRHKGHVVLSSAPNRSMMASSRWDAAYFLSWGELRGAVSGTEVVDSANRELCDTGQPMAELNYASSDIRPAAGPGFTLACSLQLFIGLFDEKNFQLHRSKLPIYCEDFTVSSMEDSYQYIGRITWIQRSLMARYCACSEKKRGCRKSNLHSPQTLSEIL